MKKLLAATAAALLLSTQAQASHVSYSTSYTASDSANWTEILSLTQFDSSLGTLQSVTLTFGGTFTTTFYFENRSAATRAVSQSADGSLTFTSASADASLEVPLSVSQTVSAWDGTKDYAGTSGYTQSASGSDSETVVLLAGIDDLSAFIGSSTFSVSVTADDASTATAGNRWSSIVSGASATLTVDYEYTAALTATATNVPEPGSLALVGAALGAAGIAARRRRA